MTVSVCLVLGLSHGEHTLCVCLPTRPSVNCLRTSPLPLSSLLVSVSLQSLGSQTASSIPRVYRGQDLVLAMIGVGSRFETPTLVHGPQSSKKS